MSHLPEEFIKSIQEILPASEAIGLFEGLREDSLTSIRLNPLFKGTLSVPHEKIEQTPLGYFLKNRPNFTADPAFHAGLYYPQEANSMWIGNVFDFLRNRFFSDDTPVLVLDLCAAPGGKSTDISSRMLHGDILVANEVISSRNSILFENLCKWGIGNTVITKADALLFGKNGPLFDMVFIDAPCSGEGMFRKDPKAIDEWSPSHVNLCTQRQQRIVVEVWDAIKPGGFLIYSTCTFNRSENEDNIAFFIQELGASLVPFEDPHLALLYQIEPHQYRCLPHLSKGEGLFFCILQKPGVRAYVEGVNKTSKQKNKSQELLRFDGFTSINKNGETYLLRGEIDPWFLHFLPGIVHPGVPAGASFKGKWKPHPAIALLKNAHFNLNEEVLNEDQTLSFLRREFVPLIPQNLGAVGVKYKNMGLGTANAVKNGLNNLLPMEWRVRNNLSFSSIVE